MGRKIVCESCGTEFKFEVAKDFEKCPVCGKSFDDEVDVENQKEKQTYYYYDDGRATLTKTLYSNFTPLYTFEAVDMADAERQLKEVMPNSPLFQINPTQQTRCPYCYGTQIQIVPKKWGLIMGFATNGYNRVCVRCQRKF